MRGIRFNITNATLDADVSRRSAGQILPTTRRVMYASILLAEASLQEPIYLVDIQAPKSAIYDISSIIVQHRGSVQTEEPCPTTGIYNLTAFLPVIESFGFESALRSGAGDQVKALFAFDHWQRLNATPEKFIEVVANLRRSKELSPEPPQLDTVSHIPIFVCRLSTNLSQSSLIKYEHYPVLGLLHTHFLLYALSYVLGNLP